MSLRTIYRVLQDTVALHGAKLALSQPIPGSGEKKYKNWTWNEHLTAVNEIAMGLDSLGIRKGDVVVLCAETRAEFYLADIGILAMGAISAALYTAYPSDQLLKTIRGGSPRALVVENPKILETL